LACFVLLVRARAAEADALAISTNIQALHVPFGTVLDPIYAAANSSQIIGYTRCGDSALWTGHYLAAEAFRYRVTQSPDALINVKQALAAVNSLIQVTGTNLLARCLVPINSPYAAGIASEEASNGIHTNSSAGLLWVGNTSRDQCLGVAFGLAVAYDMVNDTTVQSSISQIAYLLIGFLTGHDWSVVMPDGSISTTFLIRPDQILTLLQIGRHLNPGRFSTDYDIQRVLLLASVLAPVTVDIASDSSYFKFNLDYISYYNLIRLESSPAQSIYQAAYDELRSGTKGDQNAMFDVIDRALKGPDATRDAEAAMLINQWLQRSRRDFSVNVQNVVLVCGGAACTPIPVVLRPPDEYLWQESPFQLSGGGSGKIETAGVDYILPYWMGRYYGVIPAIEVDSAAAPSGAVTPDSIASIYGSNLAATTTIAGIQPPPFSLGGITLTVTDSVGVSRPAALMYVSASQINFVVPAGTATGTAQFSINGTIITAARFQTVAPTLFSMAGDGRGAAAAYAIRSTANPPSQTLVPAVQCSGSSCNSVPIVLDSNSTVTLVLFGTGIRNRTLVSNVVANIGGTNVPVFYAGPQPSYEGFDQINVNLPVGLSGSGTVNVFVTVDGQISNVVSIDIQ
jgi:uncharacterized protein (TIGR03437 family)